MKGICYESSQEIVQVMEGVSVTLMMTSNSPYDLDYNKVQFYEYLTNELLDRCKAVVLKVYAMDKKIHLYGKQKPSSIDDILKTAHLSKATSIKHKLCKYIKPLKTISFREKLTHYTFRIW